MSLVGDLLGSIDTQKMGEIAGALGESHETVAKGMPGAVATILGGLAGHADNPGMLQKILSMAPAVLGGASSSGLGTAAADPDSPLMSAGKQILSSLFGGCVGQVAGALGAASGLGGGKSASLLALAAPLVMSFLGKRVKDDGMNMAGFGALLQREAPAIQSLLPAGVSNVLSTCLPAALTAAPAALQAAAGRSSRSWLLPLLLLALIPAIWLISHGKKSIAEMPPAAAGTANRVMTDADLAARGLPRTMDLYFRPGSMQLSEDAQAELRNLASALASNPNTRVSVNAYTDDVGNETRNLQLSQDRADAVKSALVRMGISEDRLTATGFGERNPIGDNTTPEGRAANNRVSLDIYGR